MNRGGALVLLMVLAAAPAAGVGYADPEHRGRGPIFFEEPDPRTQEEISSALEDLRGNSISDHTRGREALQRIGLWAVPPLVTLLRTGNSMEKRNAALALGVIGEPESLSPLLHCALTDRHQFAPVFCALMAGLFCDPSTLPLLHRMIREPSRDDRRVASLFSVAKVRDAGSFSLLLELARGNPGDRLKRAALLSLGFFRDRALIVVEGHHRPLPVLVRALRSSNARYRRAALLAIALLGHRDLREFYERPALLRYEGDTELRRLALLILGRFPDREVTELLVSSLRDQRSPARVRMMAALILMDRKDSAAREKLLRLNPRDAELRAAVTLALSNFESRDVLETILGRLTDQKDQVRAAAAIALSRFEKPEHKKLAIDHLSRALRTGPLDKDVKYDFRRARTLLERGEAKGEFVYLGNREFVLDMSKDIEERLLDFVNREIRDILGVESLTPLRAGPIGNRFRVDDSTAELRDLKEHLDRHPYFTPEDIPPPKLTVTPRRVEPAENGKGGEEAK